MVDKKPELPKKAKRGGGRLGRLSVIINGFVFCLVLLVGFGFFIVNSFEKDGPSSEVATLEIPEGAGLSKVTSLLEERGLVSSGMLFKVSAYYKDIQNKFKFGEYEIPAHASMSDIQNILTEGKAIQLAVTVPEGLTSWQIVQRLNAVEGLSGEVTEIPEEGSLAPNTYAFTRDMDRQSIIDQMKAAQIQIIEQAWSHRNPDIPIKSPEELLILASIIEKETGNAEERPLVASVFTNRLRDGMKLQTDPTIIYGITLGEGTLGRGIRKSELARETPYNTYIIPGLPPTPIANPGQASLQAAANPAQTEFIYFVAKTPGNPGDGHVFAKTLEEHNDNVAAYRAAGG